MIFVFIFRKADNFTNFEEISTKQEDLSESDEFKDYLNENKIKTEEIDKIEFDEIRQKYLRQKLSKKFLREIFVYSIFIGVLIVVIINNKDVNSFHYQNNLKNLFAIKNNKNSFDEIVQVKDIWIWFYKHLISVFDSENFYNSNKTNLKYFLNDLSSFLIGNPIIRQLRIKKNICKNRIYNQTCYSDYDFFNREKSTFNLKWTELNSNTTPKESNYSKYLDQFKYYSSDDLETNPYLGVYSNYFGGGYVYKLDLKKENSLNIIKQDLDNLQQLSWIDQQTRALFIEFSLYNVNLNLFAYCTILFELLPTGNIIKSLKFQPVILYEANKSLNAIIITFNIIYLIFIVFFMFKNIRSLMKQGFKQYFKQFWIYIEWTIFSFSFASLAIYLYRLYAKQDLFDKLSKQQIAKLQLLSYWNEILGILFGFLAFFGILKFLKLLNYNKNIKIFVLTCRSSFKDLLSFFIIFLILWIAFVQLMYLILNEESQYFSTIVSTFETTFLMILNRVPNELYIGEKLIFKIFISIFFYLFMVFILLNLLVSIITDNFDQMRKNEYIDDNYSLLKEYLIEKLRNFFKNKSQLRNLTEKEKYFDSISSLENTTKKLLENIEKKSKK